MDRLLLCCGAILSVLAGSARAAEPRMGRRSPNRATVLVENGRALCTIVYPSRGRTYAALAEQIAAAIEKAGGARPPLKADTESVGEDGMVLRPELRKAPLIFLGNINNNRAIIAQYAAFRCAADARYPGGDGYVLRTIANPCGTGQDRILIGASTEEGARRGVAAFLEVLKGLPAAGGRLSFPHLLKVVPGPEFAAVLKEPSGPLSSVGRVSRASVPRFAYYAVRYAWSGHIGWARRARQVLLAMMKEWPKHFPDLHYNYSELIRGWDMVEDSGVFTPDEMTAMDNHILQTLIAHQKAYWRGKAARRTVGGRHHTAGTSSFHLMVMHLLRCGTANEPGKEMLLQWKKETEAFLHAVAKHSRNPHDSATALDAISDTYWYCLEFGDLEFFTSDTARGTVDYSLMCWDNMGYAAGIDGYEAATPGYVRTGRGIGLPLAVNAFVYQDGRYKKLLRTLPNPTFQDWFMPHMRGIHEYATGPELAEEEPGRLTGVTTLGPVKPRFEGLSKEPYDKITRGVTGTKLPYDRAVEKVCYRTGFTPDDQYLLLQCLQGSRMGTIDGNCIVRFCEAGHIFLFHSASKTGGRTHHFKNGVHVSRGLNPDPSPACCSLDACADLPGWGLTTTTLPDYHGTDWERSILWKKEGFFAVIDRVRFKEAGDYAVSCNWRTPQHATWDGAKWTTVHNGDTFALRPAQSSAIRARREELIRFGSQDGATAPWVLREQRRLTGRAGDVTSFANVFYVVRDGRGDTADVRAVGPDEILLRDGEDVTLLGVKSAKPSALESFETDAASYAVSRRAIVVAGAGKLAIAGLEIAAADQPLALEIDLGKNTAVVRTQGKATVCGKQIQGDATVETSEEIRGPFAVWLGARLSDLWEKGKAPSFEGVPKRPPMPLKTAWEFDGLKKAPVPLPVARVTSSVPAEKGWPVETVVDTLIPSSTAAIWSLEKAVTFELDLARPEPIAEIRIQTRTRLPTLKAEIALDDGPFAEVPVQFVDFQWNRYKGRGKAFRTCLLDVPDSTAQKVRLRLTGPGRMALNEIEIGRKGDAATLVEHTCVARLKPGALAILLSTDEDELVALNAANGQPIWRRDVEHPISALAAFDVDGDGIDEVFIGLEDANVLRLDAAGKEVWRTAISEHVISECELPFAISMYRAPGQSPRLVVGHYHYTSVIDPATGKVLEVKRTGGAYNRAATRPAQLAKDGPTVCFLRNTWGASVACIEGKPKLDRLSGLGGMPRLFEIANLTGGDTPQLVDVTDDNVRLHELPSRNMLFAFEPLSPIGAATVLPGRKQIVLAMADGFLLFVNVQGEIARKVYLGEGAVGAAALGDRLLFATSDGLLLTDADGTLLGALPGSWLGVRAVPEAGLCVAWTTDGHVLALKR